MKKILIVLLLLFSVFKAEAQTSAFTTVDSLLQIGRYKIALAKLDAMSPTFLSAQKTASIYEMIDEYHKAISYYEKALSFNDDYLTKLKLGTAYKKVKRYSKAIAIFENLANEDPDNLLVQYRLGKLYLILNQSKKVIKTFAHLINKDSENANYSYQLGLGYAMQKKRNKMINSFLDAYKKQPRHINAIHRLAVVYMSLRDRDSSSLFVEKGLMVNPNHFELNKLKINELYRQKKYIKAVKLLENIDSIFPNEAYTQKMLGRSLYNLKDYDKAEKCFDKAIQMDRSDFKSQIYLGHIYYERKEFKTATWKYQFATFMGKEKRDGAYYGLGRVFYELKKPKNAIDMFKKATNENSKNYKALYQLASMSDDYYKDKKIGYELYEKYINFFEKRDTVLTNYAKRRISEIKKEYFLKGETLE